MKKGELTRQHIIATAAPLFNQRGLTGCSLQDLMEATGLEKGGIYRHFSCKEELAAEAIRYSTQQVVAARTKGLDAVKGAIAKLRFVVRAFVHVPSPIPGGCPLMKVAADAHTSTPAMLAAAREGIENWKSRIIGILAEGIAAGEIRSTVKPQRTANTVISTLEGALMISRLEGNREAMHDAQESLNSFLDSLAA